MISVRCESCGCIGGEGVTLNNARIQAKRNKYKQNREDLTWLCPRCTQKTKKRVPIKKVSEKGAEQNLLFEIAREIMRELHPVCQFPGCTSPSVDCHHRAGRERGRVDDLSLLMMLCRFHHRYIHDNPKFSYENGYLITKHTKIKEVGFGLK